MLLNSVSVEKLARLSDFAAFVGGSQDLRADLEGLIERAAAATEAGSCSIMLLSEGDDDAPKLKLWGSTRPLPETAWQEATPPGESIAGRALAQGVPVLVADIERSEYASLGRNAGGQGRSFICVPIEVHGRAIGVINLSSRPHRRFDASHLGIATIVATLVAKSVQVERLQRVLRSRVAQLNLAHAQKEVAARIIDGTLPPARVAKLLAKSFFKDLSSAGFEPAQIIEAASEIISLVSGDIARFRKRAERDSNG